MGLKWNGMMEGKVCFFASFDKLWCFWRSIGRRHYFSSSFRVAELKWGAIAVMN